MIPRSRREELEVVSDELKLCDRGGFAMMTRYDSTLVDWWNPAQQRLLATSEYKRICEDVRQAHGKDTLVLIYISFYVQRTEVVPLLIIPEQRNRTSVI